MAGAVPPFPTCQLRRGVRSVPPAVAGGSALMGQYPPATAGGTDLLSVARCLQTAIHNQRPMTSTVTSALDWLCAKSSAATVRTYRPEASPAGTRNTPTLAFSASDQRSSAGRAPYILAVSLTVSASALALTFSSSHARKAVRANPTFNFGAWLSTTKLFSSW